MVCERIWPPRLPETTVPEEWPQPLFVEDEETNNNTDKTVNVNVETII
jgi:hypothetical protein